MGVAPRARRSRARTATFSSPRPDLHTDRGSVSGTRSRVNASLRRRGRAASAPALSARTIERSSTHGAAARCSVSAAQRLEDERDRKTQLDQPGIKGRGQRVCGGQRTTRDGATDRASARCGRQHGSREQRRRTGGEARCPGTSMYSEASRAVASGPTRVSGLGSAAAVCGGGLPLQRRSCG